MKKPIFRRFNQNFSQNFGSPRSPKRPPLVILGAPPLWKPYNNPWSVKIKIHYWNREFKKRELRRCAKIDMTSQFFLKKNKLRSMVLCVPNFRCPLFFIWLEGEKQKEANRSSPMDVKRQWGMSKSIWNGKFSTLAGLPTYCYLLVVWWISFSSSGQQASYFLSTIYAVSVRFF